MIREGPSYQPFRQDKLLRLLPLLLLLIILELPLSLIAQSESLQAKGFTIDESMFITTWHTTWWALCLFALVILIVLYAAFSFLLNRQLASAGSNHKAPASLPGLLSDLDRESRRQKEEPPDGQVLPLFEGIQSEALPMALIVEDNAKMSQLTVSALRGKFRAMEAINEADGLDKALKWNPDVIILDVRLPKMDGLGLCQQLKNDSRTRNIPIVFLPLRESLESQVDDFGYNNDAYLIKPFKCPELLNRLFKLASHRHLLRERFDQLDGLPPETHHLSAREKDFMKRVQAIIKANLSDPDFNLHTLCRELGMARSPLHNKLKSLTGRSTTRYIRAVRLYCARELLSRTDHPVCDVAYGVGFKDPNFFSTCFKEEFGLTPSLFRKKRQ